MSHTMNNFYALVIGIANYQHINKLPPAILKDAQDIYDLLIDPQYCGYRKDNVQLLLDCQATQSAIRQSLSMLAQHLLNGLRGAAPGPGGVIRIFDLFHYLQPKVIADQPNQHPIFKAEIEENFPVALSLGGKASAAVPTAPPSDEFRYDVFISYRQQEPDKTWVRKTLRPHLEAKGLRVCIDHRDFRLGAPLVLEMARAVEQSRYTLAILTPAYLNSNFTELENVLADQLGLERSERRLLAVLREQSTPRLGMRARIWLDMTDDDEFEINIERLVYELRQAPEK